MTRTDAVNDAAAAARDGRYAKRLAEWVAQKSVSMGATTPDAALAFLEGVARPALQDGPLGMSCRVLPNPVAPGAPFLLATRDEGGDLPTVLIYGHGDTVPTQDALWTVPAQPLDLTETATAWYGRGSADNKGQFLVNLAALESVLAARGRLGFNLRIIFEMGEEIGSPGLDACLRDEAETLAADVLIASDGPRLREERATVYLGSRSALNFDLWLDEDRPARHSGNFGGICRDPALRLIHALASIADGQGRILVPGWQVALSDALAQALEALPHPADCGVPVDAGWGDEGLTANERLFGQSSFAVLAMDHGAPEAPVNAIANRARATCQLRYTADLPPEGILPALRAHLDAQGFGAVQMAPRNARVRRATRTALDEPWVARVAASLSETAGVAPDLLPNLAGSIPNDAFQDALDLPTIWIPHSYPGSNQHGPDEHMLKSVAESGLAAMAGLFWDLAD